MDKLHFWKKYNELKRDCFKNYTKMEEMVNEQLRKYGTDFFNDNKAFVELARFESTLPQFCKLYEENEYDNKTLSLLFFSYVRLGDIKNVVRIKEKLRVMWDGGFEDFQPSDKVIRGNIIYAKYDYRIQDFAEYLLEGLEDIEKFLNVEFKGNIPRKIYVNLINYGGPSPFNSLLYEMFIKCKKFNKSAESRKDFQSSIVHETTHFINDNYLLKNQGISHSRDVSCHKVIDEGYATWIEGKFVEKSKEQRIFFDNSAYHGISSNFINLSNLKNNWHDAFNQGKFMIYSAAASFIYFLEDFYGYEKVKNIFADCEFYLGLNSFEEYICKYFQAELDVLLNNWKQKLFIEKGNNQTIEGKIIDNLSLENKTSQFVTLAYDSKFTITINNGLWIYDNKMMVCQIENLGNNRIKVYIEKESKMLKMFIYKGNLKQIIDLNLEEY